MRRTAKQLRALLWRSLPVAALYALVLQAFLAGAAPAVAFHPESTPLCSEMAAGANQPGAPAHPGGHDGDCLCLASCTALHGPVGLAGAPRVTLPERNALALPQTRGADEPTPRQKIHAGPGARGPPRG